MRDIPTQEVPVAKMPPEGDYQARKWPIDPTTINQWGGPPPLKFLLTGFPSVPPDKRPPSWVAPADRTMARG